MNEYHIKYSLIFDGVEYPHAGIFPGKNENDARKRLQQFIDSCNYVKPTLKIHEVNQLIS